MKRINNIFDSIVSMENIQIAYEKARKGKSKRHEVVLFEKNLAFNLQELRHELAEETYKTSEYDVFMVYEPKERQVYRLPFRDRIVHHAIMNILEPVWNSIFITNTYSCIKRRGIHGALKHIKRDLKDTKNTQYCLKLDIKKFYPSIDHDILKQIIRRKIKDKQLLDLLDGIIDSATGVPIGNYLSQFFANLYLSYFDHWMKEEKRVRYYYRYADDMVILGSDKPYLHGLLVEINDYLTTRLNLQLKRNYQVFPVAARGVDFVGYVFRHTHILMRKSIKKNLCRKASKLNKKSLLSKQYKQQICHWLGWAKYCNSIHLIKTVLQYEKVC